MINTKITCSIIKKFSAFDAVALSRKKHRQPLDIQGYIKRLATEELSSVVASQEIYFLFGYT